MNYFDLWNTIKKKIDGEQCLDRFPKEGEVWICIYGKNVGVEQNGFGDNFSRPVLIVKKFNNQMFWSIPLSSKQKQLDFYYNFIDPNNNKVSIILAQMRLISIKRLERKLYDMSTDLFQDILIKLKGFL